MRFSVPLLTVVGTAAGAVAAVVAYQAGAGAATGTGPSTGSTTSNDTAATSRVAVSPVAKKTWLPCEKGSTLRKGVCVKVKKKVVVVYDPAPAAPVYAAPAPTASSAGRTSAGSSHPHAARA
ncbi:MAG: hypothetical protein ABI776_16200, partial [Nocardioidaceae bacterium]